MSDPGVPRIPTTPCPALLRLADGSQVQSVFWLLPEHRHVTGGPSLDVLLDGGREFFAVGHAGGASSLVRRDQIVSAELSGEDSGLLEQAGGGGSLDIVTLHLDSGDSVSGILRGAPAEAAVRMSDFFNAPGRFVTLALGTRVLLVNKARIVRVSF